MSLKCVAKQKTSYVFAENLIRGLDDDEVDFLDVIDRAKMDADKKQQLEERNELRDFREKVASLQEKSLTEVYTTGVIYLDMYQPITN